MKKLWEQYKLTFYILLHPFDGFYAMKYENKGTLKVALINYLLLWLSISFNNQYSSIIVNTSNPMNLNSLLDGGSILLILVLWSASNWSVTSLTDGEGKFKEIIMANCYAMTPIILTFIPAAIFSNFLAEGEGAFYTMIISVAIAAFILYAFVGMVIVHNFTATKALVTVLLTIVALIIIVFLIALLTTLWQQLVTFAMSVYTEIIYRY